MSDTAMIKAKSLLLIRDGTAILNEVTTHISRGKITMLLGHNGAGKSLLLQTLHGIITPDSGEITIPPANTQKMVFQKPILLRRSASQHFDFLCPYIKQTDKNQWFERAGLINQMHTPARKLSGGEQQKLAFIGALASKPDLLFSKKLPKTSPQTSQKRQKNLPKTSQKTPEPPKKDLPKKVKK